MRAYFLDLACVRPAAAIAREFNALPYEPYKPVVWQLLEILHAVNVKRKTGGKGLVSETCIKKRRCIVRPFHLADADYDPAEDYAASPLRRKVRLQRRLNFVGKLQPSHVSHSGSPCVFATRSGS